MLEFVQYLNSKHDKYKFTFEIEKNNQLPFLDVLVTKCRGGFQTSVYKKPTSTDNLLKFDSFISFQYKKSLIATLISRSFKISSKWDIFFAQCKHLSRVFTLNGYPAQLFQRCLTKFVQNTQATVVAQRRQSRLDEKAYCYVIPYLGRESVYARKRISKLIRQLDLSKKFRLIFRSSCRLSDFFRFKDRIPVLLQSNVIYCFNCDACNASYIGQTSRHLKVRSAEHMGLSWRTEKAITFTGQSAIHDHIVCSGHQASYDSFTVLSRCDKRDLSILESLFINQFKPSLNIGIPSAAVSLF